MMNKEQARTRRGKRTRMNIREANKTRLSVHRTPRHIYAQVISGDGAQVLAAASTVEKSIQSELKYTGNVSAAERVGQLVAERALKAGVADVAFDRAGYLYHGRIKALAEGARKGGLKF